MQYVRTIDFEAINRSGADERITQRLLEKNSGLKPPAQNRRQSARICCLSAAEREVSLVKMLVSSLANND